VTVLEAVAAFAADGKGALSVYRVGRLLKEGRIPGYIDKHTGEWVVTEAKVLPKKAKAK
jgi:hypothetical protein